MPKFRDKVEGIIQLMDNETLIAVANEVIDLRKIAQLELLSRGLILGERGNTKLSCFTKR